MSCVPASFQAQYGDKSIGHIASTIDKQLASFRIGITNLYIFCTVVR